MEKHTPENPYCSDLSCSCHTDLTYHAEVTGLAQATPEAVARAYTFLELDESEVLEWAS